MKPCELRRLLHYCDATGIFTWKVKPAIRVSIGDRAGCVSTNGYVYIRVTKKTYMAHRLAFLYMLGEFPKNQVDHINGVRGDNTWGNLRPATRAQNLKNSAMSTANKSGVTGVFWYAPTKKWQVHITVGGKKKHLGFYVDFNEAVDVRKAAELLYGYHPNHGRTPMTRYKGNNKC